MTNEWRLPLGACVRNISNTAECSRVCALLEQRYGNASTAALVVAYVENAIDFITPVAFLDHVEGNRPKDLTRRIKAMRQAGEDPVGTLECEMSSRFRPPSKACTVLFTLDEDF